jgi:hypothetical protein
VIQCIVFVLLSSVFLACPNPITDEMTQQIRDLKEPVITVQQPEEGSSYPATVLVTGEVSDQGAGGGVVEVRYRIIPEILPGGDAQLKEDGSFSFAFSTTGFTGPMAIEITAVDMSGNTAVTTLNLKDQGQIPSFTAEAGNGEITLSWDTVPLTDHYTIYYTDDGSLPSQEYGEVREYVESPCTFSGMQNGRRYVFLLQAHSSSGEDNWSDYVHTIPLSPYTLMPQITDYYKAVRLDWPSLPGAEKYRVWRAEDPQAPPVNISGEIEGTSFTDERVGIDSTYYYSVQPAGAVARRSGYSEAMCSPFPPGLVQCSWGNTKYALRVGAAGNYVFVADEEEGLLVFEADDASSVSTMNVVHKIPITGVSDMAGDERYLYAVTDTALHIVDTEVIGSEPITATCSLSTDGNNSIALSDGFAFITGGDYLYSVDVSDPPSVHDGSVADQWQHPDAETEDYYSVYEVEAQNGYVYARDNFDLEIIAYDGAGRFSHVANPTLTVDTHNIDPDNMYVSGSYLYIIDYDELYIVDISSPETIDSSSVVAHCDTDVSFPEDFSVSDGFAYLAGWIHGITILDVRSPASLGSNPAVAHCDSRRALDIHTIGNHIFVADGAGGLAVFDYTIPGGLDGPEIVGSCSLEGAVNEVRAEAAHAYAASPSTVVDISPPGNMSQESVDSSFQIETGSQYTAPFHLGSYLFVSEGESLYVLDAEDPSQVTAADVIANCNVGAAMWDIFRVGDVLYGAALTDMYAVRIASPASVSDGSQMPSIPLYGMDAGTVRGDIGFVSTTNGVSAIDLGIGTTVSEDSLLSSAGASGPQDIVAAGDYAYTACLSSGMEVIDISDPYNLSAASVIASYSTADSDAQGIDVSGAYVFLADGTEGLKIIDVSDPEDLDANSVIATVPGDYKDVAVRSWYAYAVDQSEGSLVEIDLKP